MFQRQLNIFDQAAGEILAEVGMQLAVETADRKVKDWSRRCWQLFLLYLRRNVKRGSDFMIEDFRRHVTQMDLLEEPPSNRAFGFLAKRGLKEGWIEFSRVAKVKNKKAHATPANVWRKL